MFLYQFFLTFALNNTVSGDIHPIITGLTDDVFILPNSQATRSTFFASSVDNVGNRKPLSEAMLNSVTFDFPVVIGICSNNCSGNGNCTAFGNCICDEGYFGNDCGQGKISHTSH